jgi:two-component system response regulator AtoC
MADLVRSVTLGQGKTYSIGRDPANDIVISHDSVSRKHACVRVAKEPALEDTGSRNGTRANGRLLGTGERVPLRAGTIIHIGLATIFVLDEQASDELGPSRISSSSFRAANPIGLGYESGLPPGLVLKDERMIALYRSVRVIAQSDITVLLLGETGVGKDVLAEAINAMSARRDRAFVRFNSAALPESLVESELFGYARGAFTGADKAKLGLFEAADGGTLFLDEVAELSLQTQAKLLRVIETGELFRVGAAKPTTVNVRLISATNCDLPALVAARQFRVDLFYRLNGVTVNIPPLRDRAADIPALTEFFAAAMAGKAGRPAPEFSEEAMAALCAHRWPGNARELKNVIERAVVTAEGRVDVEHLQLKIDSTEWTGIDAHAVTKITVNSLVRSAGDLIQVPTLPPTPVVPHPRARPGVLAADADPFAGNARVQDDDQLAAQLRQELARRERYRIVEALMSAGGNQARAAHALGISRRTLINRLDSLSISRPRKRTS